MRPESALSDDGIREAFEAAWPQLVQDMINDPEYAPIHKSMTWLETVLQKNVPFGKLNRGLAVVHFYRELKEERTDEDDKLANILGWCIEIMQAACLIADDIMDGSEMRRGKVCWYREPHVKMSAINDLLLLENIVYQIFHKYFTGRESHFPLVQLFHKIAYQTILGQSLDTRIGLNPNINEFNEQLYSTIVTYKTSFYTFYCPVAAAMILADVDDPKAFRALEEVMLEIGYLFQVQDDYLDCYGDPEIIGKNGTDIADSKCSWLIVQALKLGSEDQIKTLKDCYGDGKSEEVVREIYMDLKLPQVFMKFEDSAYDSIMDAFARLPKFIPQKPLHRVLNSIYRREK
jgi:farnesyl diphosphate synthase